MITREADSTDSWNIARNFLLAWLIWSNSTCVCVAQATSKDSKAQKWTVIVVGLPGDADHAEIFSETASKLKTWLTETLDFPSGNVVHVLSQGNDDTVPLSADRIRSTFADLKPKLGADDSLWIFLLGHGNYDGKRAWFHVAGRDPSNEDVGRMLADLQCREQVIWLTHSSSGWFVKPLSRTGRIVIAATATDDESNETEFPHALATVSKFPIAELDLDQDNAVSVAELYTAVVKEVLRRFKSDNRLPTEHAQLDDNGDGVGTEDIPQKSEADPITETIPVPMVTADGEVARRTIVPYRKTIGNQGPEGATP